MNIFENKEIAQNYDRYYHTEIGKQVDQLEKKLILSLLPSFRSNQNLLEVGCGTGHWTEFLSSLGYYVTAIDASQAMLEIAVQKKIKQAQFINANAEHLPFDNENFDIVVSITMLEFVNDIQKVVNEMFRVLKKHGWLILGCLNLESPLGKNKSNDATFKNAHFFTKAELNKLLSPWGTPNIYETVFYNDKFQLLPNKQHGAFLGVNIQKIKQS